MSDENKEEKPAEEKSDTQKAIEEAVAKLKTAADTAKELAEEAMEAAKKIQATIEEIQAFKEKAIQIATDMIKEMGSSMVGEISKMITGGSADLPGAMKNALTNALTALGASLPPKPPAGETPPAETPPSSQA